MDNDEKNEISVIIKKEAFRNILTHILRFSHGSLEESLDIMGFCLGHVENQKEIIIKNAIPVSHGNQIDILFSQDHLDIIKKIEEKYQTQNLDLIGWYISHPSNGLDWTENDIQHHLIIQNESRPNAFCMVFDSTQLREGKDFQFKIYRLKDYKDGKESKKSKLSYTIEKPNSLDYFKWVQKFVEDYHKSNPILIKEIEEVLEKKPETLQEIPLNEIQESDEDMPKISSEYLKRNDEFADILNNLFQTEINRWMEEISEGTILGNEKLLNSTIKMKKNLSLGMERLKNWFQNLLTEQSGGFKKIVQNYIENRIQAILDLESNISEQFQLILNNSIETIKNKNEIFSNQVKEKIEDLKKKSEDVSSFISNNLNETQSIFDANQKLKNDIKEFSEKIIQKSKSQFDNIVDQEINRMNKIIEINRDINQKYSDIEENVKKLEKAILNLRNL